MTTSALSVARTGLDAQMQKMRVTANNLANVNTVGFKRDRANFETMAYQTVVAPGSTSAEGNRYATGLNLGTGVQMTGTARIDTQGTLQTTDNALDLAIEGGGYFQVTTPDGGTAYTRAGNFTMSAEGVVVTGAGMPLQPQIQIPDGATAIPIGTDGTVSATVAGQNEAQEIGRIEIARFANPAGLLALGGNLVQATGASGEPQVGAPGTEGRGLLRSGALEGSNVNVVEELVDMIETQRAYEVNSKMVQSISEMMRDVAQKF